MHWALQIIFTYSKYSRISSDMSCKSIFMTKSRCNIIQAKTRIYTCTMSFMPTGSHYSSQLMKNLPFNIDTVLWLAHWTGNLNTGNHLKIRSMANRAGFGIIDWRINIDQGCIYTTNFMINFSSGVFSIYLIRLKDH